MLLLTNFGRIRTLISSVPLTLSLLVGAVGVAAQPDAPREPTPSFTGVSILAFHDLPSDDSRSQELSGLAWDERTWTLYAISDDRPKIVPLQLTADFGGVKLGDVRPVQVPARWDGEGIALIPDSDPDAPRFYISDEIGPHVFELDAAGAAAGEIPLPTHLQRIRANLSLEALSITADSRYLFTANEQALDGELPGADAGSTVRILRQDLTTGDQIEAAYRTDASGRFARGAVADVAALSATELLVLERSYRAIAGNSVRVYRMDLAGAANVIDDEYLTDATPAVTKTLVIDLADLPDADFPPNRQPQPNRILDNFEGMAIGPQLPDGRWTLFLVSDDNKSPLQVARLLILAVPI